MQTKALTALAAALMLTACGGGGGGSGGSPQTNIPMEPRPPQVTAAAAQDPASTKTAAARVATSAPIFGSVTQSANKDGVSGISTDRASTTFNGETFVLRVDRRSGNDIDLNSDEDHTDGYLYDRSPIPGHDAGADGYIIDYRASETTAAYVGVSWLNSDPSDYLAGGYWLHISGDVLGSNFLVDEAGAFMDGPELSLSNRPTMPARGSATYTGYAEGLYASTYGSDFPTVRGETEIGLFYGGLQLTADFAARTVGGCVGCNEPIVVDDVETDYRLRLGTASFDSRGTFRGSSMTLQSATVPIASTTGNWGGMFSNRLDSSGEPRLAAGTLGGEATTTGGTETAFVGAWYGTK